jgi:hypothetical protein
MAATDVTAEAFADITADKKERIRVEHERALTTAACDLGDGVGDEAVVRTIVAARLAGMTAGHVAETLARTLDPDSLGRLTAAAEHLLAQPHPDC